MSARSGPEREELESAASSKLWTTSRSIPAPAADSAGMRAHNCPARRERHGNARTACNWRFRVPDGEVVEFVDENLGPQRFVAGVDFGDFVVWRRDDAPSYQLACVADDAAMRITEVVRGADLLKSTARQILLNRALGFDNPAWYHCRLVVDHNGRRLAKRHDALSLRALRQRGLTPMNILSGSCRWRCERRLVRCSEVSFLLPVRRLAPRLAGYRMSETPTSRA